MTALAALERAVHRGELLIEREPDGALVFRHADGAAYGKPTDPRLIETHAKVFSALSQLGFREGEVKTVLSELRADAELDGATVERLLREALCRIRPKPRQTGARLQRQVPDLERRRFAPCDPQLNRVPDLALAVEYGAFAGGTPSAEPTSSLMQLAK